VAIFSAKHHWTAPRSVQLQRLGGGEGFGFSVRGDGPVIVAGVDQGSLADVGFNNLHIIHISGSKKCPQHFGLNNLSEEDHFENLILNWRIILKDLRTSVLM
jgi:hypothetical protein